MKLKIRRPRPRRAEFHLQGGPWAGRSVRLAEGATCTLTVRVGAWCGRYALEGVAGNVLHWSDAVRSG